MRYQGRILSIIVILFMFYGWFLYAEGKPSRSVIIIPIIILQALLIGWLGVQYDKVKYMANRDTSTDLFNRRYTMDRLFLILRRAKRANMPVTILMIDANDLKWVNDTYGHLAGDEGIQQIARVLRTYSGPEAVIGRLGGDEFVVIFPRCDQSVGRIIAQSIQYALEQQSIVLKWALTVSIGIAVYPKDGEDPTDLLKVADKRMYHEKEQYHTLRAKKTATPRCPAIDHAGRDFTVQ